MSNNLPEGAYVIDNWKFSLTEKFEKFAQEQWLTIESTKSLKSELEQFYWPWKKLYALEPYMKKTIERKVGEAREQLASATKALKWVTINQDSTAISMAQTTPSIKDISHQKNDPSIQNVLFWKLWETIQKRNNTLKNI